MRRPYYRRDRKKWFVKSTVALRHYVDLSRRLQMLKAAAERV